MENETLGRRGLSAFQLKVLAVVFMTIDHIGAFAFEIPLVERYNSALRIIGRLAAPLFLFLLTQSVRHTRSKGRFLLRLYLAAVGTELFVTAMNLLLGERLRYFTPGNILFTFFYTVLYIVLAEKLAAAARERDGRTAALCLLALAASVLPTVLAEPVRQAVMPAEPSMRTLFLINGLLGALLPAFGAVDYGLGMILLGVVLYFAGTKNRQCLVFFLFCVLCWAVIVLAPMLGLDLYGPGILGIFSDFFNQIQLYMVFALPLMLLYDGRRGRSGKWFFYLYYPLHRELIFLAAALFFPAG